MGRGRSLSRRPPRREPRVKITIFCEGAVTEPDYLGRFAAEVGIKLLFGQKGGKPAELVEAAIAARRATRTDGFAGAHEIWAVFDRDDHPHIPELRRRAAENDVGVARAERLRAAREQDGTTNPYTDVDVLLHLIRDNGRR